MISAKHRFHRRNSLNNVYRHGKVDRMEYLSLRHIKTKREDYRLAVVVSRKVSKSAVVRNRIRRRIYEAVRLYKMESSEAWPMDMIISVFDDRAAKLPSEQIHQTIRRLLQKAGI